MTEADDNLELFPAACDHLPMSQRCFIDEWLVCMRCGKRLRPKNLKVT